MTNYNSTTDALVNYGNSAPLLHSCLTCAQLGFWVTLRGDEILVKTHCLLDDYPLDAQTVRRGCFAWKLTTTPMVITLADESKQP